MLKRVPATSLNLYNRLQQQSRRSKWSDKVLVRVGGFILAGQCWCRICQASPYFILARALCRVLRKRKSCMRHWGNYQSLLDAEQTAVSLRLIWYLWGWRTWFAEKEKVSSFLLTRGEAVYYWCQHDISCEEFGTGLGHIRLQNEQLHRYVSE